MRRAMTLHYCAACGADSRAWLCAACRKGRARVARSEAQRCRAAMRRAAQLAALMRQFCASDSIMYVGGIDGLAYDYAEAVRTAEYHARRSWTFAILPRASFPYGGFRDGVGLRDPEVMRVNHSAIRKGD